MPAATDAAPAASPGSRPPIGATRLAAALLVLLAGLLAAWPLAHDDLFLHLHAADWMRAHRAVPKVDPFSFTRAGAPWMNHEWGFSLVAGAVHAACGFAGLIAWRVGLVLAIGVALWPLLRRPAGAAGDPLAAIWLLTAGVWACSRELILRAALVGDLFLALTLLAIARERRGDRRALYVLPLLFLVWANVHAGVVVGLFVLALFAGEDLWRRRGWRGSPYPVALAASAVAALCNPHGIALWLFPLRLARLLRAPGWDLGHFAAPAWRDPAFALLLLVLLTGLLPVERARRLSPAEAAGLLVFAGLALISQRAVFDLAVFGLPVAARLHAGRLDALDARRRRGAAVATVVVLAFAATSAWRGRPAGLLADHVPVAPARFLAEHPVAGRLFHHQNYGGYLGWRLREPIFWDGRNDVFAPLVPLVAATPFAELAARWDIAKLVLTEREWRDLQPELATGRWALVLWDDFAAVYVRRSPENAALVASDELRLFPPFGGRPGLRELVSDPSAAAAARRELEQVLAANPRAQRARYFQGVISLYRGERERARRELEAALAIRPNDEVSAALELARGP